MIPARRPMFPPHRSRLGVTLWMVSLAAACAGFVLLGNWQVRRLSWKLALIHDVTTRVHALAVAAPGPAAWPAIRAGHLQYLHVRLQGHFLAQRPVLVHGASTRGYGFWVMAPLRTDQGFVVLVNRGYVPPDLPGTPASAQIIPPAGETALTGLLRFSEPHGGFLRPNRPGSGQWYSRDVAAITQTMGLPAQDVAPYFVDADAAPDHRLPAGGLTKVHFRNQHLQYAITWYALALGTLLATGVVLRRERHGHKHPSK